MSHSCGQETELMNIETAHHHEEDKMRVLYEASYKGCVSTLNSLLQEDPGLLQKISSQTMFIETPLHISASHGHLEFTETLLSHKPELALERNSSRSTPLHLASAEGHINIVKKLVEAREEVCVVRDQEGRIPLHYAVIRGRRDVVLELAKPDSLKILDDMGKTIFHLCVMYNQLEILKDLVELDIQGTQELLIEGDLDGKNTILHLAIMFKQVETVSYLISIPKIRSEAPNMKNGVGYTALDIIRGIPKDSKSLEIQVILMESGIKCGRREKIDVASESCRKKWWSKNVFESIDQRLKYNGDWLEDMRGSLSLVATVIATITFQAALNPPKSIKPEDIRPIVSDAAPADPPRSSKPENIYDTFITYNTISFIASLCVALLLVSGVPLKRGFVWMLSIGMVITLACLLNAYVLGVGLVFPSGVSYHQRVQIVTIIFVCLNALVGIYIGMKLVIWIVKKFKGKKGEENRRKAH